MRGVVLILVAHLVACEDEPPMPDEAACAGLSYIPYVRPVLLSAYSQDHLKIAINLGSATYNRSVVVRLEYDARGGIGRHPYPIEEGGISYCPEFDSSFKVSLDGIEVAGVPGGWT